MKLGHTLLLAMLLAGSPAAVPAQNLPPLDLPDASPAASVALTLGLTDMEIRYARPAVNGRKIWGALVPYGEVWRAGANENTTIAFSTPVTVDGMPLDAGIYGLHMIPTETAWTVIFSRESKAWGSFSYDASEDAARITVTPVRVAMRERLRYEFDDPSEDQVTVALEWETVRVPFLVKIDLTATVTADLRQQLRGLPRFGWQGWQQAANWLYTHQGDLTLAGEWTDRSIRANRNFTNLMLKAAILEKQGQAAAAGPLRAEAAKLAGEAEINNYGYQLLAQGKKEEAVSQFQRNVKQFPNSWNAHDSLAEGYASLGRTREAVASYRKALSLAADPDQKKRIESEIRKLGP